MQISRYCDSPARRADDALRIGGVLDEIERRQLERLFGSLEPITSVSNAGGSPVGPLGWPRGAHGR
jgi:hypothetical protein